MDAALLATLSRLLDEALLRAPSERLGWLESLGSEYEPVKPRLRRLLTESFAFQPDFLSTLPKLAEAIDAGEAPASVSGPMAGDLLGAYRLVRLLAEGGMGSVWLAERADGLFARPVALKLPRGQWRRADLAARVAREREILASLEHPNIARLYDAGVTADGRPYLALEYVEGRPIEEYCTANALDVRSRVRLVQQVARAVAHAHAKLVIHRDLKPGNILVTDEREVRLLDFGIAKLLDEGQARDSTVTAVAGRALTPEYASPEQVAGAPLGVATDVYSLGVVLYELVAGVRPYRLRSGSPLALEEAILEADVRRPSEVARSAAARKALRGDLDTIILKALKKSPAERYITVDALSDDLERFLDGRTVRARPDSRPYRLRRFVGRHRLAVAASAAATLALLAGAAVAVWQASVARGEQARADQVAGFITSIFRDVDPFQVGAGRSVTAAELLTRAERQLDRELGAQPLVRADLLRVLGESYLGLSDMKNAERVLTRAVEEHQALLPVDDPASIDAQLLLADSEHYLGKTGEASSRVGRVVALLEQTGHTHSEPFVRSRLLQVRFLINEGRAETDEAERAALAARDAALAVLGPDHAQTAHAFGHLATVYRWRRRQDLAIENSRGAYELLLRIHGDPKHPEVIQAQNTYGRALNASGFFKLAVPHLKESAVGAQEVLGGDVAVQQFLGTLANAQIEYGEVNEAVDNLARAAAMDMRGVEVSDAYEAGRAYTIGRALVAARRPAEAFPHLEKAIALFLKAGDVGTRRLAEAESALALIYMDRLDEAQQYLDAIIGAVPQQPRATREAQHHLGLLYRTRGERERALDVLDRARAALGENPRERVIYGQVLTELALTKIELAGYDEALALARQSIAALEEAQGVMSPSRADALVALARAHIARKAPEEALPLLESAGAFWRAFAPDSRWAAELARYLAAL
jgi:serine/threonine-protein kinase